MATREADGTVYTHAGPEIGVASTKAFTSQLVALHLLALFLAQTRGTLPADTARRHLENLHHLPRLLEQAAHVRPGDPGGRAAVLHASELPLSGAWHQLPDRPRGRR